MGQTASLIESADFFIVGIRSGAVRISAVRTTGKVTDIFDHWEYIYYRSHASWERACVAGEIKELIANIGTIFGPAKFVFVLAFHNFPGAPWPFRFNAKCVYNASGTSKAGITATYLRMTSL